MKRQTCIQKERRDYIDKSLTATVLYGFLFTIVLSVFLKKKAIKAAVNSDNNKRNNKYLNYNKFF